MSHIYAYMYVYCTYMYITCDFLLFFFLIHVYIKCRITFDLLYTYVYPPVCLLIYSTSCKNKKTL